MSSRRERSSSATSTRSMPCKWVSIWEGSVGRVTIFWAGREVDPELRAQAGLALHFDPALVLFDDAVDGGQAQAGALAHSLGGEERIEDPERMGCSCRFLHR